MKRGTIDITNIKRGSTDINKVYRGDVLVWEKSGIDPDAQAFLTAASITDPTITTAIDGLVKDLKSANLWTKMKAVYPVVGGTEATHKFNLKDPQDTDAAFRLTFNGTWTHNSDGMVTAFWTGFNQTAVNYATTHIIPSSDLDRYSNHIAVYSTLNKTGGQGYSGSNNGTGTSNGTIIFGFSIRSFGSGGQGQLQFAGSVNPSSGAVFIDGNSDVRGLNVGSRLNDNDISLYRQKVRVGRSTTQTTLSPPVNKITLNALKNNNSQNAGDNKQISFCSLGDGLTQTDVDNLFDLLDTYQGILNRKGIPTGAFPSTPV